MPGWLQILQAIVQILQAIAVFIVAAVGSCLAWQQVRIADAKLQHDLFDRRFQVFDKMRRMLANVCATGGLSDDDLRLFTVATGETIFLFDDALAKYFDEEMKRHLIALIVVNKVLDGAPVGEQRTKAVNERGAHILWLGNQLEGLRERFKPFMKLEKHEAGCWQAMAAWFQRKRAKAFEGRG